MAKLYGVSLDELLATDDDVDTIVNEQVKDKEKERTYVFPSQYDASRFLGWGKKYVNNRLVKNKANAFSKDGREYELSLF